MPRQNRTRTIGREEDLARRIAYEREQRGWSYAGLASRMTKNGCAIDPSALYKIENATPRRRISVDELVALARVFGFQVGEMLVPPEIVADKRAVKLLEEFHTARQALADAWFRLATHAVAHPRVAKLVTDQLTPEDLKMGFSLSVEKFRENSEKRKANDG